MSAFMLVPTASSGAMEGKAGCSSELAALFPLRLWGTVGGLTATTLFFSKNCNDTKCTIRAAVDRTKHTIAVFDLSKGHFKICDETRGPERVAVSEHGAGCASTYLVHYRYIHIDNPTNLIKSSSIIFETVAPQGVGNVCYNSGTYDGPTLATFMQEYRERGGILYVYELDAYKFAGDVRSAKPIFIGPARLNATGDDK